MPGSLRTRSLINVIAVALVVSPASAAVINEILIGPSGPNIGQQFFELRGTSNESLAGQTFVQISGEGSLAGEIETIVNLNAFSLGANGLLLFRDAPPVLLPPPDPQTTVVIAPPFFPLPLFFGNESMTFLLVSGFTGFFGQDLDINNDGVLETTPWTTVHDAIGIVEDDSTPGNEFAYGTQLGFDDFPFLGFNADSIFRDRITRQWVASDVDNVVLGGPYTFDPPDFADINGTPQSPADYDKPGLTPGVLNAAVPEPGSITLFSAALAGLLISRRLRRHTR